MNGDCAWNNKIEISSHKGISNIRGGVCHGECFPLRFDIFERDGDKHPNVAEIAWGVLHCFVECVEVDIEGEFFL